VIHVANDVAFRHLFQLGGRYEPKCDRYQPGEQVPVVRIFTGEKVEIVQNDDEQSKQQKEPHHPRNPRLGLFHGLVLGGARRRGVATGGCVTRQLFFDLAVDFAFDLRFHIRSTALRGESTTGSGSCHGHKDTVRRRAPCGSPVSRDMCTWWRPAHFAAWLPQDGNFGPSANSGQYVDDVAARILVLDNYDSFVYNLVQYIGELGGEPMVFRNDAISVDDVLAFAPDAILLSPGPGRPEDAGIMCDLIEACAGRIPMFGVCLGHQAIGHVFGGSIVRAPALMHGKTSSVSHDDVGVLRGLASPFTATRYHSLVIDPATMPSVLTVTASTADGIVMAVRHCEFAIEGVQFHPESVLTEGGHQIVRNFLAMASVSTAVSAGVSTT
jgi:anthranilate synthase/aminodeoxychorismate synthase-like glutamine amidotransferase